MVLKPKSIVVLLFGILLYLDAPVSASASEERSCITKYLELDIDTMSDQPPSCNSTEIIKMQELLSHVVNKRFGIYGNEIESILDIATNGVCPTSSTSGADAAGSDRALQKDGQVGFVWKGGPKCNLCSGGGDGGDALSRKLDKNTKHLTVEEQMEKLKKKLEKQLCQKLTRKVNRNPKSCLTGVSSTVTVDITPMDKPPSITCVDLYH